jgi:negative modulator of initiation of replication
MKSIAVDDDLYEYIAKQTKEIGESASSILRRLLNVPLTPSVQKVPDQYELAPLLEQAMFKTSTTAVARMLRIFKEAHEKREQDFHKVLNIQGRNRAYFAKNKEDILKSGKSTQPREIYGTGYWVMTNSPTPQKRQMVREVLEVLKYDSASIEAATAIIQ